MEPDLGMKRMDKSKIALAGSIAAAILLGFLLWQGYFTCSARDFMGMRIGWVARTDC
jgi:hypothetical protein